MTSTDNLILLEATFAVFCSAAFLMRLLLPDVRRAPSGEALILLVLGGCLIVALTSLAGSLKVLYWQSLFAGSNALLVCTGLAAMAKPNPFAVARIRDSLGHLRSMVFLSCMIRPNRRFACLLALTVIVMLAGYGVIALFSPGMNFDSNTYRLPRIAYWLQEGNLFGFSTNDHRMNYTGHNADLVMLWIMAFTDQGYRHAALAQWFGGLIAVFAIYEISRLLRFDIELRLAAVLFFCGLPTVATQFITTQFDLFAGGFLAASLTFVVGAFRSGQVRLFALAGVAFGVSLGAKATVLYFVPACLGVFVGAILAGNLAPFQILRGTLLAALFALPFASPPFIKNYIIYRNPLGYPPHVSNLANHERMFRPSFTVANLTAYVWQSLEPASTVKPLRPVTQPFFSRLTTYFESSAEPYPGYQPEISNALTWFYRTGRLTEDSVSFGSVATFQLLMSSLIVAAGSGLLMVQRKILLPAVLGFWASFIFFSATFIYMPFNFRFFILAAPLAAIVATAGLYSIKHRAARRLVIIVLGATQCSLAWACVNNATNGIPAIFGSNRSELAPWFDAQLDLLRQFPSNVKITGISVPPDSWCSPYFRNGTGMKIKFVLHEELDRGVSADQTMEAAGVDALIVYSPWVPANWSIHPTDKVDTISVSSNRTLFIRKTSTLDSK